jgi:hypothetical protein
MWLRTVGRIYSGVSRQGSRLMTGVWVFFATAISGSRKLGHASKDRKVMALGAAKLPTAGRFTAQRLLIVRHLFIVCTSLCASAWNVLTKHDNSQGRVSLFAG